MKAITTDAIITGITAKQDRSLGLRITTPELTNDEKVAFMELQGVNLKMLLNPLDSTPVTTVEVKGEVNQKTQSQRIRSVIYLLWNQDGKKGEFEQYYREKTEKYIEFLKKMLEE